MDHPVSLAYFDLFKDTDDDMELEEKKQVAKREPEPKKEPEPELDPVESAFSIQLFCVDEKYQMR